MSDADLDGIAALADRCPQLAEDCDGFADRDGCPDRDNDGDWIPDECDVCPDIAETLNGSRDEDGCDDYVEGISEDPCEVGAGAMFFSHGSTRIRPRVLADWVTALRRREHVSLFEVMGEADSGEPETLADERARAVVEALVARGIDRSRLRIQRFGNDLGIARAEVRAIRIGSRELDRRHAYREDAQGWAPEAMTCPDGRAIAEQGEALRTGRACADRALPRVRREEDHLFRAVPPAPTAVDACTAVLHVLSPPGPPPADDPDAPAPRCALGFGVAEAPRTSAMREVAALDASDWEAQLWIAIRTARGWSHVVPLFAQDVSGTSDMHFSVDEMAFRDVFTGGERELVVEWRAIENASESVDRDDFSLDIVMRALTLCSWSNGPICRTILRSRQFDEVRHHGRRVTLDRHRHTTLDIDLQPSGTVVIASREHDAGPAAPIVGTHTWPDLPALDLDRLFHEGIE